MHLPKLKIRKVVACIPPGVAVLAQLVSDPSEDRAKPIAGREAGQEVPRSRLSLHSYDARRLSSGLEIVFLHPRKWFHLDEDLDPFYPKMMACSCQVWGAYSSSAHRRQGREGRLPQRKMDSASLLGAQRMPRGRENWLCSNALCDEVSEQITQLLRNVPVS